MKRELQNSGSISSTKNYIILMSRIFETLKPRNFEAKKPGNQETENLRNREAKKPRKQETKTNKEPRNQHTKKPTLYLSTCRGLLAVFRVRLCFVIARCACAVCVLVFARSQSHACYTGPTACLHNAYRDSRLVATPKKTSIAKVLVAKLGALMETL